MSLYVQIFVHLNLKPNVVCPVLVVPAVPTFWTPDDDQGLIHNEVNGMPQGMVHDGQPMEGEDDEHKVTQGVVHDNVHDVNDEHDEGGIGK